MWTFHPPYSKPQSVLSPCESNTDAAVPMSASGQRAAWREVDAYLLSSSKRSLNTFPGMQVTDWTIRPVTGALLGGCGAAMLAAAGVRR